MLSKNSSRLAHQRIAERAVEVRIEDRVGQDLVEVLQPQPLRRRSASPAPRRADRPASASPACSSTPRRAEPALRRRLSAARRPGRRPRGRTTAATPARGRRGGTALPGRAPWLGAASSRNRNCGLASMRLERLPRRRCSKSRSWRPLVVEAHQPLRGRGRSTGRRNACVGQAADDLRRARPLVGCRRRPAA